MCLRAGRKPPHLNDMKGLSSLIKAGGKTQNRVISPYQLVKRGLPRQLSLAKSPATNRVSGSFVTTCMSFLNPSIWVTLAQAGVENPASGAAAPPAWMQFVPFIFIFLVMYALIIRPQQKKAKEHDALLKQLKAGDKVATSSGIVGVITNIKENSVSLRSADSKLEILLPAIDRVLKEKDSGES